MALQEEDHACPAHDSFSEEDTNAIATKESLQTTFDREGYLLLRKALSETMVSAWAQLCQDVFETTFIELHEAGHTAFCSHCRYNDDNNTREYAMQVGVKHGFREIVMRSPGRYEISLYHCTRKEAFPPLLETLKESLSFIPSLLQVKSWQDVQILNLSLVLSTPGSPEQTWHADGGHMSVSEHLPCHVLNVFVPLTNVTQDMGPTELRPQSHVLTRNLVPLLLAAKARKQLVPPLAPTLAAGDVLIFDYRTLHRGKANLTSEQQRSILVLTVALPWFRDILNFPKTSYRTTRSQEANGKQQDE